MKRILIILLGLAVITACDPKQKQHKQEEPVIEKPESVSDKILKQDNEPAQPAVKPVPSAATEGGKTPLTSKSLAENPTQNPNDPPQKIDVSGLAEEHFNTGVRKYQQGDWVKGIEEFELVTKMKSNHQKAYYNLGYGKFNMEDYPGALIAFEKALELNPQDTTCLLYAGQIKYIQEDYQSAINYYDRALDIKKDYAAAYYNRGTAKGRASDYYGAIDDLSESLRLDPTNERAYFNRGIAYFAVDKTYEACLDWGKAKELGVKEADQALARYCN